MKIFEDVLDKVNFVDENNVFVGYSLDNLCCEKAGWFISDKESIDIPETEDEDDNKIEKIVPDVSDFVFDTDYFAKITGLEDCCERIKEIVIFKLHHIKWKKPHLYLHIYNCHNGYYKHGFEFKDKDEILQEGEL